MKRIKFLFLTFIIVAIMFLLVGCAKKSYTITLNNEDGSQHTVITCQEGKEVSLPTIEKEGHTFEGWFNGDVKVESPAKFSADTTLQAKFTKKYFEYKFLDRLNNIIKLETVPYGSPIVYPENLSDIVTDEYTYTFVGWDNDAEVVLKNEVFNAVFSQTENQYTYTFLNEDGSVISTETLPYGSPIVYPGTLTKESTAEFEYVFKGWDHNDQTLQKNVTFRPVFEAVKRQYTYSFIADGETVKSETVDYGTMPVAPSAPEKEGYQFIGWDKEITKVVANVVYTAVYEEVVENITSLEGLKVSILGDSISTFYAEGSEMNSYYSGENTFYYPRYSTTIKTVDLTWWYKLIKNNKMQLGINNSWSGSCAYGNGASAGQSDGRINTINENGTPDIVIIYLGTNDAVNGFTVKEFGGAIETMISKIKALGAKDVFLTTLGYSDYSGYSYSEALRLDYNAELRRIAKETGSGIIPLDEYVVDDNYMIYLGDRLHYNAKGANLLSLIAEKAISEFYGIAYDKEIEVEHKEQLPEGVLGYITATANSGFWVTYATDVFFADSSFTNPTFSTRYLIKKNSDGAYYVSSILASGETGSYNCDYVIVISDSHNDKGQLLMQLENVVPGSIVEFDASLTFPLEITFKTGSVVPEEPSEPDPKPEPKPEVPEGQIHVGAYNTGVWTLYESTVIAYSQDAIDQKSTFINFNVIKLTKRADSDYYNVDEVKEAGLETDFTTCDYYILIFSTHEAVSFFNELSRGDTVAINGDITTGNANLEIIK